MNISNPVEIKFSLDIEKKENRSRITPTLLLPIGTDVPMVWDIDE